MGPRGLHPKADRERAVDELLRPPRAVDSLLAGLVLFGPALLAIALPVAALFASRGRGEHVIATFVAIGLLLAGGYAGVLNTILGAFRGGTRAAELRRVPLLPVAGAGEAAPDALVFVEGRVAASRDGEVVGPLTGRRGVWYEVDVEAYLPGPDGRRADEIHRELRRVVPFDLVDEAGAAVRVDPTEGRLEGASEQYQRGRAARRFPEGFEACLAEAGVEVAAPRDADVHERVLRVGQRVTVLGVVRRGAGYREETGTVLVGDARDELLVTTTPHDAFVRGHAPSGRARAIALAGWIALAAGLALCGALVLRAF